MRHTLSAIPPIYLAAVGDFARAAAAAPAKGKAEPSAQAEPVKEPTKEPTPTADQGKGKANRFEALFTGYVFKASDNGQIYERERSGMKSKRLAAVMVEVAHTGGYLKGSIYARQKKGADKATAEFTFMGSQNQICFTVEDSTAKAELDAWRAQVAADYVKWAIATGQTSAATIETAVPLDISLNI
jgi:hypothetical protein